MKLLFFRGHRASDLALSCFATLFFSLYLVYDTYRLACVLVGRSRRQRSHRVDQGGMWLLLWLLLAYCGSFIVSGSHHLIKLGSSRKEGRSLGRAKRHASAVSAVDRGSSWGLKEPLKLTELPRRSSNYFLLEAFCVRGINISGLFTGHDVEFGSGLVGLKNSRIGSGRVGSGVPFFFFRVRSDRGHMLR